MDIIRKSAALVLTIILLISISACKLETEKDLTSNVEVKGVKLTTADVKNKHNLIGLGTEMDPHIFANYNTNRGFNEDDWAMVENRMKTMSLQRVRIMLLPEWFEPVNDNTDPNVADENGFVFQTEMMKSLVRHLELAQKLNIEVNITFWCANKGAGSWLAFPEVTQWCSAPNNLDEWSENVSVGLNYLLNTMKFNCIKEITLYNEPSWAFFTTASEKNIDFDYYKKMCETVDARLKKDKLRDKIQLNLSDDGDNVNWYMNSIKNLTTIADSYNSHTYTYSILDTNKRIRDFSADRVKYTERFSPGKPFYINEFGTNNVVPPYIATDRDTYERGLFLAKFMINSVNGGCSGMDFWCLYDQYYSNDPSQLMLTGLWASKEENFKLRPTYYSWGLMNKYTSRNAEVYSITSADDYNICATSFKNTDGKWTYIILNSSEKPAEFTLLNKHQSKTTKLNKIVFNKDVLPTGEELTAPSSTINMVNGGFTDTVPSKGFLLFSER